MGEEEKKEAEGGACDFCSESKAVVYCRADSARLCLACDRHVHSANTVSSKHPRSLLCDSCGSAPASLLCCSHADQLSGLLLCPNCDFEAHNLRCDDAGEVRQHHHDRRPVEPFSGCPAAAELIQILGLDGDEGLLKKGKDGEDEGYVQMQNLGVWETGQVVRLDDLIVPSAAAASNSLQCQTAGLPPLPKNRNKACGKQKEQILRQLRELIAAETQFCCNQDEAEPPVTELLNYFFANNCDQRENSLFDLNTDATFQVTPNSEPSQLQWDEFHWHSEADPVITPPNYDAGQFGNPIVAISDFQGSAAAGSDLDSRDHIDIARENGSQKLTPKSGAVDASSCPDRESVISRYKEKRKTRRYDKLIRYESRKARADTRVRIKGRFAPKSHHIR